MPERSRPAPRRGDRRRRPADEVTTADEPDVAVTGGGHDMRPPCVHVPADEPDDGTVDGLEFAMRHDEARRGPVALPPHAGLSLALVAQHPLVGRRAYDERPDRRQETRRSRFSASARPERRTASRGRRSRREESVECDGGVEDRPGMTVTVDPGADMRVSARSVRRVVGRVWAGVGRGGWGRRRGGWGGRGSGGRGARSIRGCRRAGDARSSRRGVSRCDGSCTTGRGCRGRCGRRLTRALDGRCGSGARACRIRGLGSVAHATG